MKIQIASDLHLEHLARMLPAYVGIPHTGADVLVLAGDIHERAKVFEAFANWPAPIVYVHGNHELYNDDLGAIQSRLRHLGSPDSGRNIRFLENDEMILDGVRFLGACLWTDYALYGKVKVAMTMVRKALNDHHLVRNEAAGERFLPEHALEIHQASRALFRQSFAFASLGQLSVSGR